jgi:hypothetical protein
MREQTVAVYCRLGNLLTLTRPMRLLAARFSGGNLTLGRHYMEQYWGQNRLNKSGFFSRLHALTGTLPALFAV